MIKENTVAFRIHTYDVKHPQEVWEQIKPIKCKDDRWIPQTVGDQVWMWFEFENIEEKKEYLNWIEQSNFTTTDIKGNIKYIKNMTMNHEPWLTQQEIDHWTK